MRKVINCITDNNPIINIAIAIGKKISKIE